MNVQTIWVNVANNIPPVRPKRIRYKKPEDREAANAIRREKYRQTYVSKRKPKETLLLDSVDKLPRKTVVIIDYDALIKRLHKGPMIIESDDIENLRIMLRYRGIKVGCKTLQAEINGVRKTVSAMRIKE